MKTYIYAIKAKSARGIEMELGPNPLAALEKLNNSLPIEFELLAIWEGAARGGRRMTDPEIINHQAAKNQRIEPLTDEYFEAHIEKAPGKDLPFRDIYAHHLRWREWRGEPRISKIAFSKELARRGIPTYRPRRAQQTTLAGYRIRE